MNGSSGTRFAGKGAARRRGVISVRRLNHNERLGTMNASGESRGGKRRGGLLRTRRIGQGADRLLLRRQGGEQFDGGFPRARMAPVRRDFRLAGQVRSGARAVAGAATPGARPRIASRRSRAGRDRACGRHSVRCDGARTRPRPQATHLAAPSARAPFRPRRHRSRTTAAPTAAPAARYTSASGAGPRSRRRTAVPRKQPRCPAARRTRRRPGCCRCRSGSPGRPHHRTDPGAARLTGNLAHMTIS